MVSARIAFPASDTSHSVRWFVSPCLSARSLSSSKASTGFTKKKLKFNNDKGRGELQSEQNTTLESVLLLVYSSRGRSRALLCSAWRDFWARIGYGFSQNDGLDNLQRSSLSVNLART